MMKFLLRVSFLLFLPFLIAADSGLLWLVNFENTLEASYRPAQLEYLDGYPIRPEAAAAFRKMHKDMKAGGIEGLRLQSAFRPHSHQQVLFDYKVKAWRELGHPEEIAETLAAHSVARAGASEHQTGLAIDVSVNGQLSVHFGSTEAGVWLRNNACDYGFIIRYPQGKTHFTKIMYEPWHLRYVGVPHSQYMREFNLCFEEYITHVKEAGILLHWVDEKVYYKVSYFDRVPEGAEASQISSLGLGTPGYIVTEKKVFLR